MTIILFEHARIKLATPGSAIRHFTDYSTEPGISGWSPQKTTSIGKVVNCYPYLWPTVVPGLTTVRLTMSENIRIYHKCEGGIEKSISRITIWHHKACGVMSYHDPKGWIYLSTPRSKGGFFFSPFSSAFYLDTKA